MEIGNEIGQKIRVRFAIINSWGILRLVTDLLDGSVPFRRNPICRNPFRRNPIRRNANPNPKP